MRRPGLTYWLTTLALAEAAGIAVVAATYAAIDRDQIGAGTAAVLLAGGVEGLCLGSAQALGLRRLGVRPAPWIILTVLAAVTGYGLSMLGQIGGGAGADTAFDPPPWLMALAGAGVGLGMGAVMGLVQSPALPRNIARRHWVAANVVGWIPAMAAIMLAAGLAEQGWPLFRVAALGAVSGALAGACVALATWIALPRGDD
ncbi:hypothetical protein [Thalassovita aquimarina]|uniref:Uncharacterized protein n=1 Tax=Thalassovita aquimarina TaxID=2785917 RepID=A0ABS5HT88_9RHOB|nr:hypothetical protein [Thalassovita aquimarina]MBR9651798.1 hypothetical protein [Thalassovita aquimarina]